MNDAHQERSTATVSSAIPFQTDNLLSAEPSPDVMEETKYPVTPTKPRDNHRGQGHTDSSFGTPYSNASSMQSFGNINRNVEEQLLCVSSVSANRKKKIESLQWSIRGLRKRKIELDARNNQLAADYNKMKIEKSQSDERYEFALSKVIAPYAKSQGLRPDNLTMEAIEKMLSTVYHEVGASENLRIQLANLQVETQTMGEELAASRAQCQSLEKRQDISDAKLRKSLQNLAISQDEAQGLRNQVQALQKEMLAQVPKVEVVSDETLSRDFRTLASLVKSLSRSVQPAQDMDISHVLSPIWLLRDVAKHHWDTRARKKVYVEAWIWSVLIAIVFEHPFSFYRSLRSIRNTWILTFGKGFVNDWPKPTPESENWRRTTTEKLMGQTGRETMNAEQIHGDDSYSDENASKIRDSVLKAREDVTNIIKSNLTAVASTPHLSQIPDIVDQAFMLALNMSMQPFRVQITWPDVGDDFEAAHMSPIPDRNGQDIRRGVVAFVVNPGLTRWGDARGQNFEKCHEIVPSLVQLEPVQAQRRDLRSRVKIKQEREYA